MRPKRTPRASERTTTIAETWRVVSRPLVRKGRDWRATSKASGPSRVAPLEQAQQEQDGVAADYVHRRDDRVDLDDPEGVEVDPLRPVGQLRHADHARDRGVLEQRDEGVAQ